jgi:hypothetical protein
VCAQSIKKSNNVSGFDTTMCGIKRQKIYFGVLGNKIYNQPTTINTRTHTHTHSKYYSHGYTMFPIGVGGRGAKHTLTDNTHSLIYKYYIKIDICTTHTTILYIPKEEKRHVYDITQRRDEKKKP